MKNESQELEGKGRIIVLEITIAQREKEGNKKEVIEILIYEMERGKLIYKLKNYTLSWTSSLIKTRTIVHRLKSVCNLSPKLFVNFK